MCCKTNFPIYIYIYIYIYISLLIQYNNIKLIHLDFKDMLSSLQRLDCRTVEQEQEHVSKSFYSDDKMVNREALYSINNQTYASTASTVI